MTAEESMSFPSIGLTRAVAGSGNHSVLEGSRSAVLEGMIGTVVADISAEAEHSLDRHVQVEVSGFRLKEAR